MSLLARIKKLREENGNISINKLEKEAGLSRGSMAKWDDHAPSYDKLKKVADYFNVSVGYLLGTEDTKNAPGEEAEGEVEDFIRRVSTLDREKLLVVLDAVSRRLNELK